MLNLFPRWVKILVAVVLAVFAVAEAVPMVLTSWARYEAERAKLEAEKETAVTRARAETQKLQNEVDAQNENILDRMKAGATADNPQDCIVTKSNPLAEFEAELKGIKLSPVILKPGQVACRN